MAYKNFSVDALAPFDAAVAQSRSASPQLSPLEWTTVALARRDSLSSLREPGRLSRAMGSLFGRNVQSRLADPGLEVLRRLAVNAWHYGYRLPVSEMKAFLAAGFTSDQLELVLESVAKARTAEPRRTAR